ncbi:BnaA05g35280D [Brassica napus]|uniref:BnaA05g35280D protein n=1 Tax=Brassica napus TaxID=3708 RepID=A0A078IVW6_BRANA|nr:BnaA05g35280D [Brassica napus]
MKYIISQVINTKVTNLVYLLSSPNPRRIVPILARYGLQLLDEMDRF